ncbi:TPA: hypothetical protein HA265_06715 [Candidatus Woesearchaeota archaeon]|nr:hypothetical protein [Candidatus Woesearchaeota archaeon]
MAVLIMTMLVVSLTGCKSAPKSEEKGTETLEDTGDIAPPKAQEDPDAPRELLDKRGQQTDITEFKELVRRASKIESYKYTLSDTDMDEEYGYYFKQRFIKVVLPETRTYPTGEEYNWVYMDRSTKTALTRCGECDEPDKELEKTDYEKYYALDPYEMLTKAADAELTGEEMLGNDYTKVFSIRYDGKPGKVWVQEYWGYPIRFEIGEGQEKRTVEFKDMMIDATRAGEIEPPFEFTVKGEKGTWWSWEHYLGEMEGKNIPMPQIQQSA